MNLLKRTLKSNWTLFILFGVLVMIMHLVITPDFGDDVFFSSALDDQSLFSYLNTRFNEWTSRLILETVLVTVARIPWLWKILDVGMIMLAAFSITKLFNANKRRDFFLLTLALFSTVPFRIFASAGWMATTLNYIWILAIGLFAMLPIKKVLEDKPIKWFEYLLYIPALLLASNQEQMCVILLFVYGFFTIYAYFQKKKFSFMLIQTGICILNLVLALFAPGNAVRKDIEIDYWFPEFAHITFFRKLEIGYSSTWYKLIFQPNFLFLIFALLLLVSAVLLNRKKIYIFFASLPLVVSGSFLLSTTVLSGIFPGLVNITDSLSTLGTGLSLSSIQSFIPDTIITVVIFAIIAALYGIFQNKKMSLLSIFIFLLGFGSRMIMSLSPTVWASSERTFTFMYCAFMILSLLLFQQISEKKFSKIFLAIFTGLALVSYASQLVQL